MKLRDKTGRFLVILLIVAGLLVILGISLLRVFLRDGNDTFAPYPHPYRPQVPAY
jgi:hypothetical protein